MMKQFKHVRKVAIVMFALATLLTLAACGSKDKTPFGDLGDAPYLTVGDIIITEKDLYEELRLQGASILASMVDEIIFADSVQTVRTLVAQNDEKTVKFLNEVINEAIHRTKNEEALERLYEKTPERFNRNIEQFVDSLYLLDNSLNTAALSASIKNLVNTQETPYTGYETIAELVTRYELRVAQRLYARSLLEVEVLDKENAAFISEDAMVSNYRTTRQGRYEVDALVVSFINLNEANAALYQLGIKADSRGFWYRIPDIRISDPLDPNYVDLDDTSPFGFDHVRKILTTLNLLDKVLDNRDNISLLDYENYYKSYIISTTRETGLRDEALSTDQVKASFVEIYNLLNPASQVEITVDGSIVGVGSSEFEITRNYDDLNKINPSLRNHVYQTLTAEDKIDLDNPTSGRPYSSRVQTFGSGRFLVFKLSDDSESEEGILIKNPEDETKEIFSTTPEAVSIKAEIFEELLVARLTNAYITTKINALYEDKELNIYDPVVRAYYEQSFGYEGATKAIDNDTIAQIGSSKISVREFYTRLEKSYGINLALDLASNIYLVNNTDYVVSEADRADFEKQFKDIIEQFSGNQFATAGYPASMGREKFLLLAFGSTTNQEAINKVFIFPELRQQYIQDLEAHFDYEGYSIYEKLADLSALHYNNFKSINVSHLLVFIDQNGDGQPDDPQAYLDGLSAEGREDVLDGLAELVTLIYDLVGNYKGFAEGFNAIANEFNNSGRIERGSLVPQIDYQIELLWSKYRQLGFYLKFENIGAAQTNSSNFTAFVQNQPTMDKVFYNRALEIHQILADQDDDDSKFPYLDFYGTVITQSDLEKVQSSFGWHLILATSVAKPRSAIFSASDDEDGRYVSTVDETLNVYNEDSETITASQIQFYLTEQKSDVGVTLPTAVQSAFTAYLNPVLNRYNNTFMQRELIFKLLEGVTFANSNNVARFDAIRNINRSQLNDYLLSPTGYFDENYNALYGTWFTILEAETKN